MGSFEALRTEFLVWSKELNFKSNHLCGGGGDAPGIHNPFSPGADGQAPTETQLLGLTSQQGQLLT